MRERTRWGRLALVGTVVVAAWLGGRPAGAQATSAQWTPIGNGIRGGVFGDAAGIHHQAGRLIQVAWRKDNRQGGQLILWAGAGYGGLWKSVLETDGSIQSWIPLTDNFPGPHEMGSFLVHRFDSERILVGPGSHSKDQGDGNIYRTHDQGAHWQTCPLPLDADESTIKSVNRLVDDRSDPTGNTVLAATSHGIFRTTNFGLTWKRVFRSATSGANNEVTDIVQDAGNPLVWYAGAAIDHAILRSVQQGQYNTWVKYFGSPSKQIEGSVGRVSLAVSAADPHTIYALVSRDNDATSHPSGFGALWRSLDRGGTWVKIFGRNGEEHDDVDALDQGFHTNAIGADPTSAGHVFFGLQQPLESFNATETDPNDIVWHTIGIDPYTKKPKSLLDGGHNDYNFVLFRDGFSDIVIANDGGYYIYHPATETVDDAGNLLGISVTWLKKDQGGLASSRSDPKFFIAGTQDNGLVKGDSNADVVEELEGGDGGQVSIDPSDSSVMAASSTVFEDGGHRELSFDLGTHFSDVTLGMDDNHMAPMKIDPTPGLSGPYVFTSSQPPAGGYSFVFWRPLDLTSPWAEVSGWTVPGEISHLDHATEPALHQIVMTVEDSRKAWVFSGQRTDLGTLPLFDHTPPLPPLSGTKEDAHANADRSELWPQRLFYTTGQSRPSRVYKSDFGGQSWDDLTGNLPTGSSSPDFNKLIGNPNNFLQFFLATSKGVYRSDSVGLTWYLWSEGLRLDEDVQDIVINTNGLAKPTLYIATRGRGFWQRVVE